ncbi:hypothetical protein TNCV_4129311 [Trichonephila clavipes]|nr:hypothetical protein TNCV_4129311 [Trichonephila clavipes]
MNSSFNCALTITEDVSGDAQIRLPILLSLLCATHELNLKLRRLHLPENVDDLALQLEQTLQKILQETIGLLYLSSARHVASSIEPRAVSIPY